LEPESGKTILQGISEAQLDEKVERLRRVYLIDAGIGAPQVAYRETISRRAEIDHTYRRQAGSTGQFARVQLVFSPGEPGSGFVFDGSPAYRALPSDYVGAVYSGLIAAKENGLAAGFPVIDFTAVLVDGAPHPHDSSARAFELAAHGAFRRLRDEGEPVLLEPIMELEVSVPDDSVGAVNGDLNSRRGRLQGMEPVGGMTSIKAEVPMAELLTYSQSLTSMTGGRGDYHMEFLRYEEVPPHIAQKLVEAAKKEKEAVPA